MERINQDIKTGEFNRLYLLCGDDDYFRNFYKNKLKKALISDEDGMNYSEFSGKNVDVNEIMNTARTIPFLSERRVVIVSDSDLFNSKAKKSDEETEEASDDTETNQEQDSASKKSQDYGLPEFFAEIPETTVLIFCEANVKRNIKIYKALAKYGYVATFDRIKEDERGLEKVQWYIGQKLKRENKNMTRGALRIFQERTGTDLQVVFTELDKLLSYTLERDVITEDDVKLLIPERVEDKIFEMIECISNYKQKRALDLYYDLLKKKEQPVKILSLIERHYHQLYVVKSLTEAGMNWKDILTKASIKPIDFLYKKYSGLAAKYTYDDLKKAMEMCLDFDKAFRSGKIKDNVAVEMVIVSMSTRA